MRKLKINIIISFIVFIFTVTCVHAVQDEKSYVYNVMEKLLAVARDNNVQSQETAQNLEDLISSNFDLDLLSSLVLGRNKYKLSELQVQEFIDLYKEYIKTYCMHMIANFNASSFKVKSSHSNGSEFIIKTEVINNNNQLIRIDLLIHYTNNEYKIFNIIIEGINLVASQSAEVSSVIKGQGFDYLISDLKTKIMQ